MTGYLETLTDPSYFGQVVLQTFPLIGNYGVIPADFETDAPSLKGYIVREWCQAPSNFRCEGNLDTFLKDRGVPGICGIDTRALTKIVREYGVLACRIQYTPEVTGQTLAELKSYVITDAVESTTIREKEFFPAETPEYNVVLTDFGAKHNIGRELNRRGCNLTVVPAHTTAEEFLAMEPDGIMLSNGPGDPAILYFYIIVLVMTMKLRIRDMREDMDLTQQKIADVLLCDQSLYSKYERGEREIPLSLLIKLADFYGTSLDYLVGRTRSPDFVAK